MKILILGVGAGTGSDVVKCLMDRHTLQLADTDPFADAFYIWRAGQHLLTGNEEAIRNQIRSIIRDHAIEIVLANTDRYLECAMSMRTEIEEAGCIVAHPSFDIVHKVLDRGLLSETMMQAGISVPREGGTGVNLPVIVKSRMQKLENDFYLIDDQDDLKQTLGMLRERKIIPWVEEYIPGGIDQIHVVSLVYDKGGNVIARFTAKKLQEATGRGGLTLAAVSEEAPELEYLAEEAARALGRWCGPCSAKFKTGPTGGMPMLLSLKPRMNDCTALAAACGVNLPQLLLDALVGKAPRTAPKYQSGIAMVRYQADIIRRKSDSLWKE